MIKYLLVSGQLGFIFPLNLLMVLERLALCPDDLVGALGRASNPLEFATLVLLAVPLLDTLITGQVLGAHDEDAVAELDSAGLATVDAAAGNAELVSVLAHELPGLRGPGLVARRGVLLNEGEAVFGHGLDRLAVERRLGQRLELVESAPVQEEERRSGSGVRPKTRQAGRRTGL